MAFDTERGKKVLIEWEVDPSKGVDGVKKLAKELRETQKVERDLSTIEKQLGLDTDELAKKTTNLASQQSACVNATKALTTALGFSLSGVITRVVAGMGELWTSSDKYGKAINNLTLDISAARIATKGYLTDLELMTSSNRLATLGVAFTSDEFANFAGIAKALSAVMGTDVKGAIDDFTKGLARGSAKILDNLGIMFSNEKALEDYAANLSKTKEELTETEKKQAVFNAAMRAGAEAAKNVNIETGLATEEISKMGVAVWDLATKGMHGLNVIFGETIANLKMSYDWYVKTTNAAWEFGRIALGIEPGGQMQRTVSPMPAKSPGTGQTDFKMGAAWAPYVEADKKTGGGGGAKQVMPWERATRLTESQKLDRDQEKFFRDLESREPQLEAEYESRVKMRELLSEEIRLRMELAVTQNKQAEASKMEAKQLALMERVGVAHNAIMAEGKNALGDFATGLWNVAEAAVAGNQNVLVAILSLPKAILMSIAQRQTAKAIEYGIMAMEETAAGTAAQATTWGIPNPSSVLHFAAASMYTGLAAKSAIVGVASGIGGIALGAGISALGSGESAGGGGRSGAGGSSGAAGSTPRFGKTVENKQPINVNVYLGDPTKPATAMLLTRQIASQISTQQARMAA